jgi:hypothetical protein
MGIAGDNTMDATYINEDNIALIKLLFNDEIIWASSVEDVSPIPEPTTMLLFGTGLLGLSAFSRRNKKNS